MAWLHLQLPCHLPHNLAFKYLGSHNNPDAGYRPTSVVHRSGRRHRVGARASVVSR